MRIFITSIMLIISSWAHSATLTPQFKRVELKENTILSLSILPDAGTQLIFPFELDNPDLRPNLKIRLTNGNGFTVPSSTEEIKVLLKGQNTITIEGKANQNAPDSIYLGNLFITIGGYNLSIGLKTTFLTTEHVSNIIFDVDGSTREHMIESAVRRKTETLDKLYREKMAKLDSTAKEMSLSHVSIMAKKTPTKDNYKDEGRIKIDNKSITIFADKLVQYGNEYFILIFDIENKTSSDFTINSLNIFSKDGGNEAIIKGAFACNPRLNANTTLNCSFSSLSSRLRDAKRLKLQVSTDRGSGEFIW